ncbi:MAG: magnesium transporter, partial [Planctomycetes bacterium]|nr:magnesium transporter [Planctomycetota bacterium]
MSEPRDANLLSELLLILPDISDREGMRQLLQRYHPADIGEAVNELPHEIQARLLRLMEPEEQGDVLDNIDDEDVAEHAEAMPVDQLSEIVSAMPPDEAAYLLDGIDDEKAKDVLENLEEDEAGQIRELLSYPPDTAGRIMNNDFFHVAPQATVHEALEDLKAARPDSDIHGTIIVCREDMKFLGTVQAEDMLTAADDAIMASLMERAAVSVSPLDDQEVCARYMHKYQLDVLPVLDERRRIIGLIDVDDILEVMKEEASEDIYRMVGVGSEKPLEESALVRAAKRLPWFTVNLVNLILLTYIMSHYQLTFSLIVATAFFIPAIPGLSGNIGVQAATITVRGLANGEIRFGDVFWILRRELLVGMIIGVICSLALGVVSYFYDAQPETTATAEAAPPPAAPQS